jgi:diaminopimelate decarboxylase
MSAFTYRHGTLCADNIPLTEIAEKIGTPFYAYSQKRIEQNYQTFFKALADLKPLICYAVKTNPNISVIRSLRASGAGADVTSAGELQRALKAGISPQKIIFSGVGKTRGEITTALKAKIFQINAESIPEIHVISSVAKQLGVSAPLALRVNPNVAARTYRKTSTGEMGTKFGIDSVQLEEAMALTKSLTGLDFKGFQIHVGSHVFDYEPFREAFEKLVDMVHSWREKGYVITRLDLGGGVTIPYDGQTQAPFSDYAQIVRETVGTLGCELAFEPGRFLVGDAGILVARVIYDKQGASKRFLILDAGMNDLIRPAMYEARHSIIAVKESNAEASAADVVGPICETSDLFGEDYLLPGVAQDDLVAILQAGAYGAAMSSNYNGRALIPEVLVTEKEFHLIRRRVTVEEQMLWEDF